MITIQGTCYNDCSSPITFINLHDDENTSVEAAEAFLEENGGMLVQLKHSGKRNLAFKIKAKNYVVDPNRIYTPIGIKASLIKSGRYTPHAALKVKSFADQLLQNHIDGKNFVVALHNNTDKGFSIISYKKGGSEAMNAAMVYINTLMDADDFILTTEKKIFDQLQAKEINVVLQNNRNVKDDGSLSVYAARKKIPYINVEAQDGHLEEQIKMLHALKEVIIGYQSNR